MNAIGEYLSAGGPLMVPLALLCLAIWYWIAWMLPQLGVTRLTPARLRELFHKLPREGMQERVRDWAKRRSGALGRAVAYAVSAKAQTEQVQIRLREAELSEISRFEVELKFLKAMVAAAPLLGLLGTVRGMIATFLVLASRGTASVELLSAGISEALVTTQVGLVVALPGVAGVYAIRRRIEALRTAFTVLESHMGALLTPNGRPADGRSPEGGV
jgi:biopolymer transport protein ExbB